MEAVTSSASCPPLPLAAAAAAALAAVALAALPFLRARGTYTCQPRIACHCLIPRHRRVQRRSSTHSFHPQPRPTGFSHVTAFSYATPLFHVTPCSIAYLQNR